MNNTEMASPVIKHDSDSHALDIGEITKGVTHTAKRKLVLHNRNCNRRHLDQEFTAGNTLQHVTSGSRKSVDSEGQTKSTDGPGPTFWQNIFIMFTTFPYWNMAFWDGWLYSLGSVLFIISSAWSWVPLQWPETEFPGETYYGVPLTFFFGATIFYQTGAVMAYLEAINDGSFAGAAMKRLVDGNLDLEREMLDAKLHTFFGHIVPHHHNDDTHESIDPEASWKSMTKSNDPGEFYDTSGEQKERRGGIDEGPAEKGRVEVYIRWRWWPTWHAFRTYHVFDVGFDACMIQLFGVTLYSITSVVGLPGILANLEWWQALGAYWWPQVIAACCFLTASVMFTIMEQDKWYKPKPGAVSWWIGIWAGFGSVGFFLCAVFGVCSNSRTWAAYQSPLSSMWGSFFYMLSGLFQWYEAINTNVGPVLAFPNNRTPILLRKSSS